MTNEKESEKRMKRVNLSLIVSTLALTMPTLATLGCTGTRGGDKGEHSVQTGGKLVKMEDVDDSLNDKVKGERFRITYDETDAYQGADEPLVTIVEFSDFQCPYCSRFANTLHELLEDPNYAKDVRVVFKHFPLSFHKQAQLASEATLAAGEQGKFWEMHDLIFKNQKKLQREDLEGYAKDLGLDLDKFKQALDNKTYEAQVKEDLAQGMKFGVQGTPSFFINGKWQRGAPQNVEILKKMVDEEKKAAEELVQAGSARAEVYARIMRAAKDERAAPPPQQQRQRPGQPDPKVSYAVPVDDRPVYGKADALVTIVEFSDFQCPYCSRVNSSLAKIKETYPEDVRVVFRQFPLGFHDRARPAAKASLAAHRQGKFWEMHDKLFANQKDLSEENFVAWAKELGLDVDQFQKDYKDPAFDKMIEEDMAIAQKFGARGTPAFFINGRFLSGAQPFEQFDALIKEEKAKAEKFAAEKGVSKDKLYEEMRKGWENEVKIPPPPPPADFTRRDVKTAGLPGKGNLKNPAITIVECSDFDCPFCSRAAGTVAQIMEKYGDQVAFYFRNYPLPMHKMAEPAHRAAVAAGKQDKFWEMHDKLFADKSKRSDEDLKAIASELGLDVEKWEADFRDPQTAQQVKDDIQVCQDLGVSGAPGFLINGRLMSGAQPLPVFEGVLKEELSGGFEATQKKKAEEDKPTKQNG